MKIYLDTCCYGRPYDDQTQAKVAAETLAVMTAIDTCRIAGYVIIGSVAVTSEVGLIRNAEKRGVIDGFYYSTISGNVPLVMSDFVRAQALEAEGLGDMDALHLAAAEAAGVDVLLTTDVDFLRICANKNLSRVRVINPLTFLSGVIT